MGSKSDRKVIMFQRGSIEAGVTLDLEDDILELLNNMIVGSNGARYLHKNIDERIYQLPNKYFMYLRKNNAIKGTFVSAQRTIQEDFGPVNSYYIRYLAIDEMFQATKNKKIKHGKPDGIIKSLTKKFLSQAPVDFGIGYGEDKKLPSFHYAFFDAQNFRSTDLSELLGMNPVGEFETMTFTRFNPKKSTEIKRLTAAEYPQMKKMIRKGYETFSVYTEQFLFAKGDYFVWIKDNEIVAGVQPNKCEWEVKNMGGISGKMMLGILPLIPRSENLFDPKKFEFLTLDYFYVKPGHEKEFELLMEGMLKEFHVKFGLVFQDVKSPFMPMLKGMDHGVLSNFSKIPNGKIMMTLNKISEEHRNQITSKPFFTCGVDMS